MVSRYSLIHGKCIIHVKVLYIILYGNTFLDLYIGQGKYYRIINWFEDLCFFITSLMIIKMIKLAKFSLISSFNKLQLTLLNSNYMLL